MAKKKGDGDSIEPTVEPTVEFPQGAIKPEDEVAADPDNVVPFKKGKKGGEPGEMPPDPEPGRLARLNAKYCVVMEGGKTWVLKFEERVYDGEKRSVPVYIKKTDFETFHQNQKIVRAALRGGGIVETPEGEWWMNHKDRRTYEAVVFEPTREREFEGKLNLWRGWGVEEKAGDWSLMRSHIEEVICSGEREHSEYVIRWMAWAVQNPGEPAEVVLVMKGKRGTGKGALANALLTIFGQHGFRTGSPDHIVGKFNAHLRDTCLVFGDEAFWPGDHRMVERLKQIVTERVIPLEGKGRDVISTKNCMKIMMASNDEWVIPAGEGERRFMMVEVSDTHMQDKSYFVPLFAQMENGGHSAMLHDLLTMDLGEWHPREVVRTKALQRQQAMTMNQFDKWLLTVLEEGIIPGHEPTDPSFAYSYEHGHVESHEGFSPRPRPGVLDDVKKHSPRLRSESNQDLTRNLKDIGCVKDKKFNVRGWRFPALAPMRADFLKRFPGSGLEADGSWATDVPARARGT